MQNSKKRRGYCVKLSYARLKLAAAAAALAASCGVGAAASLTWDPGNTPTDPSDGFGYWDPGAPNWSNGTTNVDWVNDGTETAIIGNANGPGLLVDIITDVNAGAIVLNPANSDFDNGFDEPDVMAGGTLTLNGDISVFGNNASSNGNRNIAAISVDGGTLNMTGHNITAPTGQTFELILTSGTVLSLNSLPASGSLVFNPADGPVSIGGQNHFTNPTQIGTSNYPVRLLAGSSLGNTPISVTTNGLFQADAESAAGSLGPGVSGASLTLKPGGHLSVGANGIPGTFALDQEVGYSGTGLNLDGGTATFYLMPGGDSELVDNGAPASVSGVNIIDLQLGGGLTSLPVGERFTLMSDGSGGLSGDFVFPNGEDSLALVVGGNTYNVRLDDTTTAVTATVVSELPEPGSAAVIGVGCVALLGRRRRT